MSFVYCVLRIACCVLCSFILEAVVHYALCIVYCTPHVGGSFVLRIAYCVYYTSKYAVCSFTLFGPSYVLRIYVFAYLRIAYCVLRIAQWCGRGDL